MMTLEELKAEADRQGYVLRKKPAPRPILHHCACGRKRLETWFQAGTIEDRGLFYKCPRCGRKGAVGKTERQARENWNALFEEDDE